MVVKKGGDPMALKKSFISLLCIIMIMHGSLLSMKNSTRLNYEVSRLFYPSVASSAGSGAFRQTRLNRFRATIPTFMTQKDAFDLLGISDGAPLEEIKMAYRTKVKEHHPDVAGDEATKAMQDVVAAYETLIGKREASIETPDKNVQDFPSLQEVIKSIKAGLSINALDDYGNTLLMNAAASGKVGIVKLLLAMKAKTNVQDVYGDTALHKVASNVFGDIGYIFNSSNAQIIKALAAAGIDVNAINKSGKTALDIALDRNSIVTAQSLRAVGAQRAQSFVASSMRKLKSWWQS